MNLQGTQNTIPAWSLTRCGLGAYGGLCALSFLIGLALSPSLHAADFVWIEGESANEKSMRRHSWYDSVTRKSLSGGDWLSHFGSGEVSTEGSTGSRSSFSKLRT